MKKLVLTAILFIAIMPFAKAQYFQALYGSTTTNEILSDGNNTNIGGQTGHLLVGPAPFIISGSLSNEFCVNVERTDMNGNSVSGAPFFNNHYMLSDAPGTITTALVVNDAHSVELSDQSGYAIAGSYVSPSTIGTVGVYFTIIDPQGNTAPGLPNSFGYYTTSGSYTNIKVCELIESKKNPGNFYICGHLTDAITGANKVFAFKIQQNGTLIWDRMYDLNANSTKESAIPHDILESPYLNPTYNTDELFIVGEYRDASSASILTDGFILRIEDGLGNMYNPVNLYGTASARDVFTSITASANPVIDPTNNEGFVLGGSSRYTSPDVWSLAMDNNGNIAWSNLYNYVDLVHAGGPTTNGDFCNDIIERINSNGLSEYYLAGYTDGGYYGTEDALVIKIDNNGNVVTNGQFTYGDIDVDRVVTIDQFNGFGPNSDGLSLYAYTDHLAPNTLGVFDHYLIKTYFNGANCDRYLETPEQHSGPGYLSFVQGDNISLFTKFDMQFDFYTNLSEFRLCHSTSENDGDNSRLAPVEPNRQGIVSPNPMDLGTNVTTVELESTTTTDVQVAVYDMLGKQYYTGTFKLTQGKNKLPLDVSTAYMAAGMYTVKITGTDVNKNILLMVK